MSEPVSGKRPLQQGLNLGGSEAFMKVFPGSKSAGFALEFTGQL
jgi:hypothetical protein